MTSIQRGAKRKLKKPVSCLSNFIFKNNKLCYFLFLFKDCGGCNLRFEHPLHYRTHCSVFHDPGFSLTIRKYHCKICGVAILGKDNIMKHAEKLHDGKGAYQCQYCKKFFLRLNYLEMHRTYGCAANPQRARPLCDFCGRKFCQPQKLKVHIKRMHSGNKCNRILNAKNYKVTLNFLLISQHRYGRGASRFPV